MESHSHSSKNLLPIFAGAIAVLISLIQMGGVGKDIFQVQRFGTDQLIWELLAFFSMDIVGYVIGLVGGILLLLQKASGWILSFSMRSASMMSWIFVLAFYGNPFPESGLSASDYLFLVAPHVMSLLLVVLLCLPGTLLVLARQRLKWVLLSLGFGFLFTLISFFIKSWIFPF